MTRAIPYNPVLQFMSHLVFSFKNIKKKLFELREKYGSIKGVYVENACILATERPREL